MSGPSRQGVIAALLDGFPRNRLEDLLYFDFGQRLDTIAAGADYRQVVCNLVTWADEQGCVRELIDRARLRNPDNPSLRIISRSFNGPTSAELGWALQLGMQSITGDEALLSLVGLTRFEGRVAGAVAGSFPAILALSREIEAALQQRSGQLAACYALGFVLRAVEIQGKRHPILDGTFEELALFARQARLTPASIEPVLGELRAAGPGHHSAIIARFVDAELKFTPDGTPQERRCALPGIPRLDAATYDDWIAQADSLVFFSARWHPQSATMDATLEDLARRWIGRISVGEIDMNESAIIAARYMLRTAPVFLRFREGREIARVLGARSEVALIEELQLQVRGV